MSGVLNGALVFLQARLDPHKSSAKDLPVNLPPARSNDKQLEIVFINLIKNALDAMDGAQNGVPHRHGAVAKQRPRRW